MISEILQKAHNAKTKAEKVKILQENNSQALRSLFIWNFDESVQSVVPEGDVPYTPNDAPGPDLAETQLRFEYRKFKYFVTNEVPQLKRETMWIELLEGIPAKEAELLDLVRKGENPFKNISKEIVKKAFPDARIN